MSRSERIGLGLAIALALFCVFFIALAAPEDRPAGLLTDEAAETITLARNPRAHGWDVYVQGAKGREYLFHVEQINLTGLTTCNMGGCQ